MQHRIPPPREPSGCLQTIVLSRMIARILLVPMLLIGSGFLCIAVAVYAFGISPLLGFAVVLLTIVILTALSVWEYRRAKRDLPPPDERPRPDPRTR